MALLPLIIGFAVGVLAFAAPAPAGTPAPSPPTGRSQPSAGAPPPAPAAPQTITTEPEITMALVDPDEKVFVWRSLRLQVSLTNGSLPSGIGVKSLSLSIPSALAMAAVGKTTRPDGTVELVPSAIDLRAPGERRDLVPVELKGKPLAELTGQLFSVLTYSPRKEAFVATLEYEGLADRIARTRTGKLEVKVTAHPLGMYAGAVLGSLLVALFVMLPRVAMPPAPAPAAGAAVAPPAIQPAPLSHRARDSLTRFFRGVLATAIAIFIFQTISDVNFAVSVTVHDFYGGVLLGLFGDKVAATIYERFF